MQKANSCQLKPRPFPVMISYVYFCHEILLLSLKRATFERQKSPAVVNPLKTSFERIKPKGKLNRITCSIFFGINYCMVAVQFAALITRHT